MGTDIFFRQTDNLDTQFTEENIFAPIPVYIMSAFMPISSIAFNRNIKTWNENIYAPSTNTMFGNKFYPYLTQLVLDYAFNTGRTMQPVTPYSTKKSAAFNFAITQKANIAASRARIRSSLAAEIIILFQAAANIGTARTFERTVP